jgi:uncharacterized membrane protein
MGKGRLEAFSDAVIAIILTIMVLEMKVPHGDNLHDVAPLIPVFFSYVLSFIYIGIYWNNHHHMLHAAKYVNGAILWANMHLLFWLSLIPFVTGWMGENHFAQWPVVFYGIVLAMSSISYGILVQVLIRHHGKDSVLANALGKDTKGKLSTPVYLLAVALTFVNPWIGFTIYILMAFVWVIPDRRIEKKLINHETEPTSTT